MKSNVIKSLVITLAALLAGQARAVVVFNNAGAGSNWSTTGNWVGGVLPGSGDDVQLNNANFVMDIDDTVKSVFSSYGTVAGTSTSAGGTLTIDINSATELKGIYSAYNQDDAVARLEFDGNVTITNSGGATVSTLIGVYNNRDNATLAFGPNSVLTLNASTKTLTTGYGTIEFNGTFGASLQNLIIASDNVSFGTGHDSSSFGKDLVFQAGAKLAVDGGTVLSSGRKLQVNGSGELELNGENAINDMNIVMGTSPDLLIDANASQDDMGYLWLANGTVTLDLAAGVMIAFDDSSLQTWGTGTLVISNFTAGAVSFGTGANGLTSAQLGQMEAYNESGSLVSGLSLDASGYLIPEPATLGMLVISGCGILFVRRLMR